MKRFLSKYVENIVLADSDIIYTNINEYTETHLGNNFPQQINGYDCGVFVLTFIDSLLNNNYYFSQSNMPNIRKNLLAFLISGKMYKEVVNLSSP
jgi:Ulp1 family protease